MTSSNWAITYDPAGTPLVLVAFHAMLESDELEPQLEKTTEVVPLLDAPAPFLRIGKNAVTTFFFRVISVYDTDANARAAMLDGLIAAQTATKKPLRLQIFGISGYYWQFANATIKTHQPRRLLDYDVPALVTQHDFIATGLAKFTAP